MESNKLKAFVCGLILLLLTATANQGKAQTFAEWFSQKKTLIKYLTQQIVALESLESDVKKGYSIATGGLGNIGGITGAEYQLHQNYFSSLKAVNPAVKNDPDLAATAQYGQAISTNFNSLNGLNGLDNDTQTYIRHVANAVLQDCNDDLDELKPVVSNGQIQMTDQERISKLHQIYERIKDKYVFTQHFCNSVKILQQQKSLDEQNTQTLKQYYGIN
ncbi:MAG: hypothetical protein JWP45_627 [Mucilaginibacter sp.]|nr:hypothetical protein [Mucilaginibacter sp.]